MGKGEGGRGKGERGSSNPRYGGGGVFFLRSGVLLVDILCLRTNQSINQKTKKNIYSIFLLFSHRIKLVRSSTGFFLENKIFVFH